MNRLLNKIFYVEKNGSKSLCELKISGPNQNDLGSSHTVTIPLFFKREKQIYGVDEEQSYQLAIEFVMNFLLSETLYDENGNEISSKEIFN